MAMTARKNDGFAGVLAVGISNRILPPKFSLILPWKPHS
jgi:hypothetical protein